MAAHDDKHFTITVAISQPAMSDGLTVGKV